MKSRPAPVNRIIRFSSVDGDGNRSVVFLQGCNYNCLYCHNPETRALCIHCGDCVAHCPAGALSLTKADGQTRVAYDHTRCTFCDACIKTCTHDASPRIRLMSAEETFAEVARQIPYIRGVTVSGGECTAHPGYLTELFTRCKEAGLSTLIDTNGTLDFQSFPELLSVTDGVMLDVKAWDPAIHKKVTGCDNADVLKGMDYLASAGKLFEVRTVVVPGLTDAEETIRQTARRLAPYLAKAPIRYKIIAFRPMGVREAYRDYETPDGDALTALAGIAKEEGFSQVITI